MIVFIPLVTLDALFLSSACTKVPEGAWFTLLLAIILASVFILWRYGKEAQWRAEAEDVIPASRLVVKGTNNEERLHPRLGGAPLTTITGLGIFFDKQGRGMPDSFAQFVQKFQSRAKVQVFFHMRALPMPTVVEDERYSVGAINGLDNCYRLVVRHGYNDQVINEDLGRLVAREVRSFLIRSSATFKFQPDDSSKSATFGESSSVDTDIKHINARDFEMSTVPTIALGSDADRETTLRVAMLDEAVSSQIVYISGKEELRIMRSKDLNSWRDAAWWKEAIGSRALRRVTLGVFLFLRENTRAKVSNLRIPVDKLVEVGFVKEM